MTPELLQVCHSMSRAKAVWSSLIGVFDSSHSVITVVVVVF